MQRAAERSRVGGSLVDRGSANVDDCFLGNGRGNSVNSLIKATTAIFFSLLLGAIAFAVVAVKFPNAMFAIQDVAETVRQWLTTSLGTPVEYNVWVRFLIQDQQLVFMAFVIISRIILVGVLSMFGKVWAMMGDPEITPDQAKVIVARNKQLQRELEFERKARAALEAGNPPSAPSG